MRKPTAKSVEEVNIYLEGLSLRIPDTSTDNAVARFDGTGGALQNSGVTIDDNNRLRVASGSSGGLEIGSSGVLALSSTGTPSGVSAPVGSTWRQTDANSTYGNLTGLLWNKVGTGTTLGTDWLPDFEGRWIDYTVTWTNVSMSSTAARYTLTGKTCTFRCNGTLSSAPTGSVSATLPFNMNTTAPAAVFGQAKLTPNYSWDAVWQYSSGATVNIYYLDDANHYTAMSGSLPEAWGSGDTISLTGTYEIA